MALVDQDKDEKIIRALAYVNSEFNKAENDLQEEQNPDGRFDATWVANRDASAKGHVMNAVKMQRWLLDNLSVTVPAAYSDAEVDLIDQFIRQKDDGL